MDFKDVSLKTDLRGKVSVLTGAAGGIGRETARLFAENGSDLLLIDRNPTLVSFAAELSITYAINVECLVIDLGETGACTQATERCKDTLGHCDILINNAAVGCGGPLTELKENDWDLTMHINLKVPFLLTQSFGTKLMIPAGFGRIINIASQAGLVALDDQANYCVAKAALMALTRSTAYEWGRYGITCNTVAPTVIETEFSMGYWCGERARKHIEQIPIGRFGKPKEVAAACLYLASDAAGLINGTNLILDGGYTIR